MCVVYIVTELADGEVIDDKGLCHLARQELRSLQKGKSGADLWKQIKVSLATPKVPLPGYIST